MKAIYCCLIVALHLSLAAVTAFNVVVGTTRATTTSNHAFRSSKATSLAATSALIVQNKGGGHGELGYQLAKCLEGKMDSITILQDDACKNDKEPFRSYAADLPNVQVIKAPLSDETMTMDVLQSFLNGASYDYVWDNNSKRPAGAAKACADLAKERWNTKLYVYVSSAGVYKPTSDTLFPMAEDTTPVKADADQVQFETYCVERGLPLVSFRPQYIYGEKSNKFDYMYVFSCFDLFCFSVIFLISGILPSVFSFFVALTSGLSVIEHSTQSNIITTTNNL
jgi:hypothetical protein